MAWFWCLIVRHRLRLCFAAFIATNRHGSLPLILLAKPTPAGERVWVWLRPGLSLRDLEQDGQMQKLAVACWANEVRVMRAGRKYAALIRIDITRREPLAGKVVSPLPDYVPTDIPANAPTSPGMPPVGLDLPDVPDVPVTASTDTPRQRKPRNPTTPPRARTGSTPPTTPNHRDGADQAPLTGRASAPLPIPHPLLTRTCQPTPGALPWTSRTPSNCPRTRTRRRLCRSARACPSSTRCSSASTSSATRCTCR